MELERKITPQKNMKLSRPMMPFECRIKKIVKERKDPVVCPTELHVDARPMFWRESNVSAQPSTAISWEARRT
jgi:hypothetical protein